MIRSIHITTFQDSTWGRVYIQFEVNGELQFIVKNWLKFKEHTFRGYEDLSKEPSFVWFKEENRHEFTNVEAVKEGQADHLQLTPEKYREEYGTPSKIIKRLLIELKANIGEPIKRRRGWFDKFTNEIRFSPIKISLDNKILLTDFDVEIKLDPLHKTVYFLFLLHPEGIAYSELENYKEELEGLYTKIRPDGVKSKIKKSLENLTSPKLDNSMNEKISAIKRIITSELGEELAEKYIISGSKNGSFRIKLSPELISFDIRPNK